MRKGSPAIRALAVAVLLPAWSCEQDVGEGDQFASITSRVSVRLQDEEVAGASFKPSASGDGRFVAFESDAPDLLDGDTNGKRDIFVKDRLLGTVDVVSLQDKGPGFQFPSLQDSFNPSISADGQVVAFECSDNLGGASGGVKVIWVRDRPTVSTRNAFQDRTFVDPALPPPGLVDAVEPSLSADGRYVAFLAQGELVDSTPSVVFTNPLGALQVYVSDLSQNPPVVMLASASTASPTQGCNADCLAPRMVVTPSGPAVTFYSRATDLHPVADDPGVEFHDVFLSFPQPSPGAPAIEVLSIGVDGLKADNECTHPSPSADGRYAAFRTVANNMGGARVVRRDRQAPAVTEPALVLLPSGVAARYFATPVHLSADGRFIAFTEDPERVLGPAYALVPRQAFVRDMLGGTQHVSISTIGASASDNVQNPAISGDGRWVFWDSLASNLVPGDRRGLSDVFARGPLR